jgi:hypothetical protein
MLHSVALIRTDFTEEIRWINLTHVRILCQTIIMNFGVEYHLGSNQPNIYDFKKDPMQGHN